MKEETTSSGGGRGVKRRLLWPELVGSQEDSDSLKGSDEAPGSPAVLQHQPVKAVLAPPPVAADADSISNAAPADVDSGRAVVKSPIIDGALFLEGRRKARRISWMPVAAGPQQQLQHPQQQHVSPVPTRSGSQRQQLQPVEGTQDAAVMQCRAVLAAAGSSSRGCLDLLCWGVALDHQEQHQQQQQEASPATPAAARAGVLPAPPRKLTAAYGPLRPAGGGLQSCRAARLLPGLGPSSEADLQQVRSWLAAQKVN